MFFFLGDEFLRFPHNNRNENLFHSTAILNQFEDYGRWSTETRSTFEDENFELLPRVE